MTSEQPVVLFEQDAPAILAPQIGERGFEVVVASTLAETRSHDEAGCVVCAESVGHPVTALLEALQGVDSPVVFIYDDHTAARTALDAGAAATVQRGDPGGTWTTHLAAAVERVVRRYGDQADPLLSRGVDELPDILFVASVRGRLLRWNDTLPALTGYSDEEIANMQPLELFERGDVDRIERAIGRIVMNGEDSVVADLVTKEGNTIPHEFTGSLVHVEGTQVIVGTARDIRDRLDRELELSTQAEQLASVNQVNALIRKVMGVLLAAESREEINAGVCDRLTEADGYRLAWIGTYDENSGRVEPDTWAGEGAAYLKDRTSREHDDQTITALSAIREDTVVFAQDVSSDNEATGWRAAALEHGHRAAAAIPLRYNNVTYGCLCLYAGRTDAFGQLEREVLAELGEIIAHAIHAIETRRALVSDTVTELQFRLTDADSFLVQVAECANAELSLVSSIGQPDGSIVQLFDVSGVNPDTIQRVVGHAPDAAELVTRREQECVVKVMMQEPSMAHVLAEIGGSLRSIEVGDDGVRVHAYVPQTVDASAVLDRLMDLYEIEFLSRREIDRGGLTDIEFRADVERRLTERQLDVLQTAFEAQFFDRPRGNTGEEVAAMLDISAPTFHQHLRVGERKLLEVLFDQRVSVDESSRIGLGERGVTPSDHPDMPSEERRGI